MSLEKLLAQHIEEDRENFGIVRQHLIRIESKLDDARIDVAGLKIKAGVWGAIAGIIPTLIGLAMWALSTVTK